MRTLASVPCSQKNYNSLWTTDHLFTIEIFSSPILLSWAAEFSKSFCWMKECFLWQQLEQDKCLCGTEIPCPWSRKVVPFPRVEKHFIASGVWENPRRRCVLYSPHSKDSLMASYFTSWGWGGISLSFLSTEQLTKMSPYTWKPLLLPSDSEPLYEAVTGPARSVCCSCPWVCACAQYNFISRFPRINIDEIILLFELFKYLYSKQQ